MRSRLAELGVIWDMDGVLADTAELHYAAWVATLSRRGVDFSRDSFHKLFGVSNAATLEAVLGKARDPHLIQEISEEKEEAFRATIRGRVTTFPGVRSWLQRLRSRGTRLAIASSGPPQNIAAVLFELDFQGFFDAVLSGDEGLPPKPDPALFLSAARAIGRDPRFCVVIEDSPAGVEAAERAQMRCIAVTNTHPPADLARASLIVRRLDELPPEAFEQLFRSNQPGRTARPDR